MNESVSKVKGVVWKLPEMLCNRFCIIRTDRTLSPFHLRLPGKPLCPELALHHHKENNLLRAEEQEKDFLGCCVQARGCGGHRVPRGCSLSCRPMQVLGLAHHPGSRALLLPSQGIAPQQCSPRLVSPEVHFSILRAGLTKTDITGVKPQQRVK